jgi:peroxiredoxin
MQANSLEDAFQKICAMEAPLGERMAAFSAALRRFGVPFAEAYDVLVARLGSSRAGSKAPGPGETMPPFLLPDTTGHVVSLEELLKAGPAVISLNRGHWCKYCAIELTTLSQALNEIASYGASVVSIMPESESYTAKASDRIGNAFRILSDIDNSYSLALGLTIWLGEEVRTLYLSHGLRLEQYQGSSSWFVPIPATFVVGQDWKILASYVDPDFRKRMEIEDIIAALKSTQD